MTDELINFLRDRLDEEQEDALKRAGVFPSPVVHGSGHVTLHVYPTGTAVVLRGPGPDGYDDLAALKAWADTAGGWTQARVLTDIEAKRAIVEKFERAQRYASTAWGQSNAALAEVRTLRSVALLLASAYASHSDYRENWRP